MTIGKLDKLTYGHWILIWLYYKEAAVLKIENHEADVKIKMSWMWKSRVFVVE